MKRLFLFLTAAVVALVAYAVTTSGTTESTPSTSLSGSATTVDVPSGETAVVTNVFDGDSFEAEIGGRPIEVRMLGINAPEGYECHGNVSRSRLRELIDDGEVTLVADGEDTEDRFGRLLRSVYFGGRYINATMIAEGHALVLQGGDPQERLLVELADEAYAAALGMWAPDACDVGADARVRIGDIEYDPAGRDWQNKTEEWIVIHNDGDSSADISGWILRDESSTHRYEFPSPETLAAGDELRIITGCGNDRGDVRFWCADDAVWSNGGDTVILQTAAGTVVDRVRYDGDY